MIFLRLFKVLGLPYSLMIVCYNYSANTWNYIYDILQSDLNNVTAWLRDNGLCLNTSKTKSLIIGSRAKLNSINDPRNFTSNQFQITFTKQYDYLDTTLDSEMSLLPLY